MDNKQLTRDRKGSVLGWIADKLAKLTTAIRTTAYLIVGNTTATLADGDAAITGNLSVGKVAKVGSLEIESDSNITYAKIQNISATDKVLGRKTAGAGVIEEIACTAAGRALIDDADAAAQRATLEIGNLPRRATCWADEGLITVGTALVHAALNTQRYCTYSRPNTGADGDTITWSVFLVAGTYTISTLGITGTNRGIQDIYLDADKIVSADDWYTDPGVINTIKSHGSISVATAGYHKITSTVNGKHASSTGYYLYLTKIWLSQSAD